jgi:hypothetical protein
MAVGRQKASGISLHASQILARVFRRSRLSGEIEVAHRVIKTKGRANAARRASASARR